MSQIRYMKGDTVKYYREDGYTRMVDVFDDNFVLPKRVIKGMVNHSGINFGTVTYEAIKLRPNTGVFANAFIIEANLFPCKMVLTEKIITDFE